MKSTRLDRLDHLRFLAAALVALWHFNLVPPSVLPQHQIFTLFQQGHTGVALFCVVSGFIFTRLYYEGGVNLKEYAIKRFFRIYPLFLFVIFLTGYTDSTVNVPAMFLSLITTFDHGLTGLTNVGWTVLIELQFYIMFPALLLMVRKNGALHLLGLLALFITIRLGLHYVYGKPLFPFGYNTIFGRIDQFIFGMLAALLFGKFDDRRGQILRVLAGITALIALMFFYRWYGETTGGLYGPRGATTPAWIFIPTIEAICYSAIVSGYLAMPLIAGVVARWFDAAFSYMGRMSYSIYFMHKAVFPLTFGYFGYKLAVPTWEYNALIFLCFGLPPVIAVSALTYHFIERPWISFGNWLIAAKPATPTLQLAASMPERAKVAPVGKRVTR